MYLTDVKETQHIAQKAESEMQLLIQANENEGVSQCGFAHVGHLPRSPDEFDGGWKRFLPEIAIRKANGAIGKNYWTALPCRTYRNSDEKSKLPTSKSSHDGARVGSLHHGY